MYNSLNATPYQKAGDFNLSSFVNLISYQYDANGSDLKRLNIHHLVQEINIFESIASNVITGNIAILDATGTFKDMQISGFERLEFKCSTPGISRVYDFTTATGNPVFVHHISNREQVQENAQVYVLHFCSMERAINQSTLFSHAYTNSHEAIVQDILRTHLKSKKNFFFEPSSTLFKHVIPYTSPLSAINYLAGDTQSKAQNSAGYRFFETSTGFHSRSIESMTNVSSKVPRKSVASYSMKRKNNRQNAGNKDVKSDLQSVFEIEIESSVNSLNNMTSGVYASDMVTHDQFAKKFTTRRFNYYLNRLETSQMVTDNSGQVVLGQGIIPNMIFSNGKTPADMVGRRMFQSTTTKVHNDARQPPKEQITQKRISKQEGMKGVQATIQVPGFFGINAGDVVNLQIPAYDNKSPGAVDPLSGKFLVVDCKHTIIKNEKNHLTQLTLQKDSFSRVLEDENFDTFTEQRTDTENKDYDLNLIDEVL